MASRTLANRAFSNGAAPAQEQAMADAMLAAIAM
jgi:hypothetical protein